MIADLWLPWVIANSPGPFMWNMQTDKMAKDHADTRIMPIIRTCKPCQAFFPEDKSNVRKQEIIFNNGMGLFIQGPSISNLQSKGIRFLFNDEIWIWPPGRHAEAVARTADFEEIQNSKVYDASQAGFEDDDIDLSWRAGTMEEWLLTCTDCNHQFIFHWTMKRKDGSRCGMVWDEHRFEDGSWNLTKMAPTIRLECPKCGYAMHDSAKTKAHWNTKGRYHATNKSASHHWRSFHWSSVIHRSWSKLVVKFLQAKAAFNRGSIEPLQEFYQKEMAEPWSEDRMYAANYQAVAAYDIHSDWDEEFKRFLTVDVQREEFWYVVRAWAKDGSSRRLDFGRLYEWPEIKAKQEEWNIKSKQVFVDCGDQDTVVFDECLKNGGWYGLKGSDALEFPHRIKLKGRPQIVPRSYSTPRHGDPERGKKSAGHRFAVYFLWSNPRIKNRLHRLRTGKGAPWLTPTANERDPKEREYVRQMNAEYLKLRVNAKSGKREWTWYCPRGNNHLFDCEAMQVLAATLWQLFDDSLESADENIEQIRA